jgi:hypothetical protein
VTGYIAGGHFFPIAVWHSGQPRCWVRASRSDSGELH